MYNKIKGDVYMLYSGTFSCGHEGKVNIIGKAKDREWKIERAFSNMCPDCYKKWLEEEHQRKNIKPKCNGVWCKNVIVINRMKTTTSKVEIAILLSKNGTLKVNKRTLTVKACTKM